MFHSFLRRAPRLLSAGAALIPLLATAQSGLALDAATRIAVARSQQIAAVQAEGRSARDMAVAAGQLPDPVLKLGVSNLPIAGEERFSLVREGMTMRSIGVMQELTRETKREARSTRAGREADSAEAMAAQLAAETRRETAMAWLDVYYQEAMRALLRTQIDEAVLQVQAAETAYRNARGEQADIFMARATVERLRDQLARMDADIAVARAQLARWVGDAAQLPLAGRPDIHSVALRGDELDAQLADHPVLEVARRQEALARADADVARSERHADWAVELMFSQRGPAYSNMVSVNLSVPLQWNRGSRQDREIAARLAMVERARALQEDTRRAYAAQVRAALLAWERHRERLLRYDEALIPLAQQRVQSTLTAYRNAAGTLAATLEARRMETDTRMERVRVEMDVARAWAQLAYLNSDAAAAAAQ